MRVADGRVLECSPEREVDLFLATVGGMGLTGHILEVAFRMKRIPSPWLVVETERMKDVGAFVDGLKAAAREWPWTKGWIDCLKGGESLGRGVLFRARWAEPHEAPKAPPRARPRPGVPFVLPFSLVTPLSVRIFNSLYYHLPRRARGIEHPESFFYPLDVVARLEPALRPPGLHPVPVRAARRERSAGARADSSSCSPAAEAPPCFA